MPADTPAKIYSDQRTVTMYLGDSGAGFTMPFRERWRAPDATAAVLKDGWLYTGDLGYLDEDGYLFLVDRKKDLIKTSGFQVWPREIEEVISSHPAVAEVGVVGIPDKIRGEIVKAWIVLRPGQRVTGAELKAFCRERLAPYKVPAKYEFVPDLPKTQIGKVLYRVLRQQPAMTEEPVEAAAAP